MASVITKKNKHRVLKSPGRLDNTLVLLRKVDVPYLSHREHEYAPTMMELIGQGYVESGVEEQQLVWFGNGYILNDQPRSVEVTEEVMAATEGFAVARTDTGEILFETDDLIEATNVLDGAKIELGVTVTGIDVDEDDEIDETE